MRTVEWKKKNGTMACHCIYTRAEADRLGMEYLENWREGVEGDWVLTDDDHVVQILRIYWDKQNRKLVHTCTMTTNAGGPACKLDTDERESRYTVNGKKRNQPINITAKIAAFCSYVASGFTPEQAYLASYRGMEHINGPVSRYIKHRATMLMQQDKVKERIAMELGDKMDELGITTEFILRGYKKVVDGADKDAARVAALNKLCDLKGLSTPKEKAPELPQLPTQVLDKLAELGQNSQEPERIPEQAEVVPDEVVEAITEPVKEENNEEESDDVLVGGFAVYTGDDGSGSDSEP